VEAQGGGERFATVGDFQSRQSRRENDLSKQGGGKKEMRKGDKD